MTMADPSNEGRFGEFGGMYVPETLVPACLELDKAFREAWGDPSFRAELDYLLSESRWFDLTLPPTREVLETAWNRR